MARLFALASSQYLSGTSPVANLTTTLSIAAWIRPTSLPASVQTIVVLQTAGAANAYTRLEITAAAKLQVASLDPTTATGTSTGATTLTADVDTHVGCVTGTNTRSVYLNGVLDSTANTTAVAPNVNTVYVGGFNAAANFLNSAVGEVAIWNTVLTAAEWLTLATARVHPRFIQPASLISYGALLGSASPEPNMWQATGAYTLVNTPTQAAHFQIAYPHIGMARKMRNTPYTPTPLTPPTLVASTQWQVQRLDLRTSDDGHS